MLDRLLDRAGLLSRVVVWIGGALLLFAAVMTTIDVLLRKFLNWSFGGADEIGGYLFAVATAFAMAHAMLTRTHVRIDALYGILPARVQTVLDLLAFLLLGGFLAMLTERAFQVWWSSYESSSVSVTPLVTPLAIPQGFWFAGYVFFMIVFVLVLLRLAVAVFQRDWAKIDALVGARSIDEELEEELHHAEAEIAREHAQLERERGDGHQPGHQLGHMPDASSSARGDDDPKNGNKGA
ncbi:MAG: TRAP transporter small permease [Gammaproteobacteria bacterium]|nr:TRAP transporter small permease [Gammaproteobacteria bacterium]